MHQQNPLIPKVHYYLGSVDWHRLAALALWLAFLATLSFTFSTP